jgi:hypothetical protein
MNDMMIRSDEKVRTSVEINVKGEGEKFGERKRCKQD